MASASSSSTHDAEDTGQGAAVRFSGGANFNASATKAAMSSSLKEVTAKQEDREAANRWADGTMSSGGPRKHEKDVEEWRAALARISSSPGPFPQVVWRAAATWQQWQEFEPMWRMDPMCSLSNFGYQAASFEQWRILPCKAGEGNEPLELRLDILQDVLQPPHVEHDRCTWYLVDCTLGPIPGDEGPLQLSWRAPRRLQHLRESLHDYVKEMLAENYSVHFAGAPFAHTAGPRGTTARLRKWLDTLADVINSGAVSPIIAALTLHFFHAGAKEEDSAWVETELRGRQVQGQRRESRGRQRQSARHVFPRSWNPWTPVQTRGADDL